VAHLFFHYEQYDSEMIEEGYQREKRSLLKQMKEVKTDMRALKVSFVPYILSVVLSGPVLCGLSQDYLNENCQPTHYFLDKLESCVYKNLISSSSMHCLNKCPVSQLYGSFRQLTLVFGNVNVAQMREEKL